VSRQIRQWRKKIQSGEKKSEVAKIFFFATNDKKNLQRCLLLCYKI
jgi:hypothetical protein